MTQRESLARGALALAGAGILVRVAGFLYRVPLSRWIGAEGMGIYQMAQPAFYALGAIAVGGVPVAVANLVAEYRGRARPEAAEQTLRVALAYVNATSAASAILLVLGAGTIAHLMGEPRVRLPLVALAPALYLFALQGCYRSYLQGRRLMTPSAVANILEQVGRIIGALGAAWWLAPHGLEWAVTGACFGAVLGGMISDLYLVWTYRRVREPRLPRYDPGERTSWLGWRLFRLAWPVTVGALVLPLLSFVDVSIIQRGLIRGGYAAGEATALYGQYAGMVYPLVTLPAVLTGAFATALLPVVTGAWSRGELQRVRERCDLALMATALVGLPSAFGLMVLARPIMTAIFHAPETGSLLAVAAPLAFLNPLVGVVAAALNGIGRTEVPIRNFTLALVLKVLLNSVVAGMPELGIHGVAGTSVAAYLLISWLGLRALRQHLQWQIAWPRILAGPLLAAVGMAAAVLVVVAGGLHRTGPGWTLAISLALAPVLYSILLGVTGALTWADLRQLAGPAAVKLERWLSFWPW